MTERTVPPNPYQSEPRMVQSPDAYMLQMNRQLGENTSHLKTLMYAFDAHVKKEEAHLKDDAEFKRKLHKTLEQIRENTLDDGEQKEWLRHQILKDIERHELKKEIWKKIVTGGIWAGVVGIATLAWYGFKHVMEKGGG